MTKPSPRITISAVEKLASQFGLPYESYMYDWDLIVADPERLNDFTKYYPKIKDEDEDQKICLMKLIFASLDGFLNKIVYNEEERLEEFDRFWKLTKTYLIKDFKIHEDLIEYWYRIDAASYDEIFLLTPYIRGLNIEK